jgi:hypothetical protein
MAGERPYAMPRCVHIEIFESTIGVESMQGGEP